MPKKKAAKTIQKPIITIELGLGSLDSNAPGRKRIANMPTTSTGDATRIARVKGLRTNVSAVYAPPPLRLAETKYASTTRSTAG